MVVVCELHVLVVPFLFLFSQYCGQAWSSSEDVIQLVPPSPMPGVPNLRGIFHATIFHHRREYLFCRNATETPHPKFTSTTKNAVVTVLSWQHCLVSLSVLCDLPARVVRESEARRREESCENSAQQLTRQLNSCRRHGRNKNSRG